MIMILVAWMMNISWISLAKSQATVAADLASLSALQKYSEASANTDAITGARNVGAQILQLNRVGLEEPILQPARLQFGRLDDATIHDPTFVQDESDVSSVHVLPDETLELPLFLSGFSGTDTISVQATATTSFDRVACIFCLDASRSMHNPPGQSLRRSDFPPPSDSKWAILTQRTQAFIQAIESTNSRVNIGLVTFGGGDVHPRTESSLDADRTRNEIPLERITTAGPQVTQTMEDYSLHPLGWGTYIYDSCGHGHRRSHDQQS